MRITRRRTALAAAALLAVTGAAAVQQAAVADEDTSRGTYQVVITNLTNGQPMSGPVVATHRGKGAVFELGAPASYGVVQIAENGNNEPLWKQLNYLKAQGQIIDVADYRITRRPPSYPGPVPLSARGLPSAGAFPAATQPMSLVADRGSRLSWVSMLVCTNDGFTGGDSLKLPGAVGETVIYSAYAYETSTETDNQLLANIMVPCQRLSGRSPADGAPGQNVSTTAAFPGPGTFPDPGTGAAAAQYPGTVEGGVIVRHPGIRAGLGDLGAPTGSPSNDNLFRWDTNAPVASISIKRTS